jgi:two-component system sensor histidine kinase UhpB
MTEKLKILHLEDLASDAEMVDRILRKSTIDFEKKVVSSKEEFVYSLESFNPDIILSDHSLPSFDSQEALKIVKEKGIEVPFILITATVSEEYAVSIMKDGASDYILKDRLQRLPNAITGAMDKVNLERKAEEDRERYHDMQQKIVTETSIKVQEREREDIGKELHDNINQILASTKLYLETAKMDQDMKDELLQKSIDGITMAIQEIRQLSHRLVAPPLLNISLTQAIGELIDNFNLVTHLKLHLDASGFEDASINEDIKLMLYRIVQEQVNNIIKHAKASNAFIELQTTSNSILLRIRDDGQGFDPRNVSPGIGLRNMTNRAALYNGTMELYAAPGKGCTLEVKIPN